MRGAGSQGFVSPDIAADPTVKSGYTVALAITGAAGAGPQGTGCDGAAGSSGYYLTATPVTVGTSGQRAFASNTIGTIYVSVNGVAPAEGAAAPPSSNVRIHPAPQDGRGHQAAPVLFLAVPAVQAPGRSGRRRHELSVGDAD